MSQQKGSLPGEVRDLKARIEHWRRTRARRTRMPEDLWADAVRLAAGGGAFALSQALRLNYPTVMRRVAEAGGGGAAGKGHDGFVEVDAARVFGVAASAAAGVVEVARRDGARLTIRLSAGEALDVSAVVQSFVGPRR